MISSSEERQDESRMKNEGRCSWPISTRCAVFELLYPPTTRSMSR